CIFLTSATALPSPPPYTTLFRSIGYAAPGAAIEAPLLAAITFGGEPAQLAAPLHVQVDLAPLGSGSTIEYWVAHGDVTAGRAGTDRKSTRLNSSHVKISYAVICS